jgi:hypothetical protein
MPGRKSLLLISPIVGFPNLSPYDRRYRDYRSEYSLQINGLADEAMRTGVVIHMLDIRGLSAASHHIDGEYVLAKKTGGITVQNSNFFVDGVGSAHEEMKGYYLLSYIPPANTFKPEGKDKYHRIKIKVKRKFSEIHTRDGFYGETLSSDDRSVQKSIPLREAIFSPFLYNDLTVRLASGYANKPETGYFLRSWMHLDAKDLTFIDEQDGAHAVSLEMAMVTTDIDGLVKDFKIGTLDGYFRNEDLDRTKKSGVSLDLYLPVQKPGAYYVRVAAKDKASGKIGTAYQFLEIPDLKKKRLSLSSIFVVNHGEDVSGAESGDTEQSKYGSVPRSGRQEGRKSPAIRNYLPGEGFDYMVFAYNAKKKQAPELETRVILFKDDNEVFKGEILPVGLQGTYDFFGIPIARRFLFEEKMDPGKYVLQLSVTDKNAKKKHCIATQAMDFDIQNKD